MELPLGVGTLKQPSIVSVRDDTLKTRIVADNEMTDGMLSHKPKGPTIVIDGATVRTGLVMLSFAVAP